MGRLEERIRKLEARAVAAGLTEEALERRECEEFVSRLTTEELRWLVEPEHRAAYLVPCPHTHERPSCGCLGYDRARRGLEANPELQQECDRRLLTLYERREEILQREPWERNK